MYNLKDGFLVQKIEHELSLLYYSRVFFIFYLSNGYWKLPLHVSSKKFH